MGEDKALKDFLKKVRRYQPGKVLLFGSRARGDFLKTSDYDILVISKQFEGVPFLERLASMQKLWDGKQHADIFAYTPEEIKRLRKRSTLVRTALKEGKEIQHSS